ncbi:MAG: 50S ribosomal protein L23 [Anaerolineae bacterium]|uniref:Large ribosomal subunit protein uL23 n=1 Tax=Candidatus Desulfolinea nitratireducens TaxID=2841698 RepID=A0A8J6TI89_9CHLR|nr:50S ribosomal protein L23 [Candidatus Desulfolinea nitratireducens]MBL6960627.1 50S ribosomal protein L23 [Anaerolineales bacterium]NQU29674.1 50S ribosomal protein L23 [Anaerolineae bacterium]
MTTIYDVLRRPLVTEKTNYQINTLNQYTFIVSNDATKAMVKEAVETIFDVAVTSVNIMKTPAKRSVRARSRRLMVRKAGIKKAIVTLAEGNSIEIFEGVQ